MHSRCFERDGFAGKKAMRNAGFVEEDAARKTKLPAEWIGVNLTACRRDRNLQPPAASKERYPGGKHCLREDRSDASPADRHCRY